LVPVPGGGRDAPRASVKARGTLPGSTTRAGGTDARSSITGGDLRLRWEGRFGPILIEVIDGQVFVDGGVVESIDSDRIE
jgi:hypothetical protein